MHLRHQMTASYRRITHGPVLGFVGGLRAKNINGCDPTVVLDRAGDDGLCPTPTPTARKQHARCMSSRPCPAATTLDHASRLPCETRRALKLDPSVGSAGFAKRSASQTTKLLQVLRYFHVYFTTDVFTQTIGGSPSAIACQELPASFEPKSFPFRVPKYRPAGFKSSADIPSRKIVSNASF